MAPLLVPLEAEQGDMMLLPPRGELTKRASRLGGPKASPIACPPDLQLALLQRKLLVVFQAHAAVGAIQFDDSTGSGRQVFVTGL